MDPSAMGGLSTLPAIPCTVPFWSMWVGYDLVKASRSRLGTDSHQQTSSIFAGIPLLAPSATSLAATAPHTLTHSTI
jgi:hypothetical protein